MPRHSSDEVFGFMLRSECLVSRQFLDPLQVEYLNSMLRQQNSLSRLSFLLLQYFVSRHRIFVSRQSFSIFYFHLCLDLASNCCDKTLCLELFIHCHDIVKNVATFFLWFFSTFVAIEFLKVAWVYCRDRLFLYRDILVFIVT